MSAVHGIVAGHNGAIILYTEFGKGTSFKVLLPAAESASSAIETERKVTHRDGGGRTVLIVDDDVAVRDTVQRILERYNYRTLKADQGDEGLRLYREHADEIVLVLLDLTMPGIDGVDVFREMRSMRPDVRSILMSGYNEQDATQRFVGKGLAGFLPKPFLVDDLLSKVEEVLGP